MVDNVVGSVGGLGEADRKHLTVQMGGSDKHERRVVGKGRRGGRSSGGREEEAGPSRASTPMRVISRNNRKPWKSLRQIVTCSEVDFRKVTLVAPTWEETQEGCREDRLGEGRQRKRTHWELENRGLRRESGRD